MGYKVANVKIGPRAADLEWADHGPGLHPDESVLEMDSGELVAVSVEPKWPDNNSGLSLHGWARLIEADGASKLDPTGALDSNGRPVVIETSISVNCDPQMLEAHGQKKLAKEVLLALLGEPPTMVRLKKDPKAPPPPAIAVDAADWKLHPEKAPPGTVLNPDATEAPMIPWSDEARLNASVLRAAATVKTVAAGFDPAKVLDL
jgi:hypothetical protein